MFEAASWSLTEATVIKVSTSGWVSGRSLGSLKTSSLILMVVGNHGSDGK